MFFICRIDSCVCPLYRKIARQHRHNKERKVCDNQRHAMQKALKPAEAILNRTTEMFFRHAAKRRGRARHPSNTKVIRTPSIKIQTFLITVTKTISSPFQELTLTVNQGQDGKEEVSHYLILLIACVSVWIRAHRSSLLPFRVLLSP